VAPDSARVLSAFGAVAAAVLAFLKPHEYATAYHGAAVTLWNTMARARLGELSSQEAIAAIDRAVDNLAFRYGGYRTDSQEDVTHHAEYHVAQEGDTCVVERYILGRRQSEGPFALALRRKRERIN
jgi:hypothetical protein